VADGLEAADRRTPEILRLHLQLLRQGWLCEGGLFIDLCLLITNRFPVIAGVFGGYNFPIGLGDRVDVPPCNDQLGAQGTD